MQQRRYNYYRATIFISILKYKVTTQLFKIREILHRKNSNMNLAKIINKLNEQVRRFSNCFNISKQCRIQLSKLDYLTHRLLKRLLMIKYKSKKKTRQFIYQNFLKRGTFQHKNHTLLKYTNVRLFTLKDIKFISQNKNYFNLNIYLDRSKINDIILRSGYSNDLSLLYYNKHLKQNEFNRILPSCQN